MAEKSVYVIVKRTSEKSILAGVYTNKKLVFEALSEMGCEKCFIQGKKKRLEVNYSTLVAGLERKTVSIFNSEGLAYVISEIPLNALNPEFRKKE